MSTATLSERNTNTANTSHAVYRPATSSGMIHTVHYLIYDDGAWMVLEDCVGQRCEPATIEEARADYRRRLDLDFRPITADSGRGAPLLGVGLDYCGRFTYAYGGLRAESTRLADQIIVALEIGHMDTANDTAERLLKMIANGAQVPAGLLDTIAEICADTGEAMEYYPSLDVLMDKSPKCIAVHRHVS